MSPLAAGLCSMQCGCTLRQTRVPSAAVFQKYPCVHVSSNVGNWRSQTEVTLAARSDSEDIGSLSVQLGHAVTKTELEKLKSSYRQLIKEVNSAKEKYKEAVAKEDDDKKLHTAYIPYGSPDLHRSRDKKDKVSRFDTIRHSIAGIIRSPKSMLGSSSDKKWVLNHEDVTLGELLGKGSTSALPS
ncbi:Tyrosine-protein kinase Fer isoform X2 [Aix galericulata]|nr:Tyrosine-protein kinase Fer isoform X2 [Aix galericulata]